MSEEIDLDLEFSRWAHKPKKKRGKPLNGYKEAFRPELLIKRSSCVDCVLIERPTHITVRPCAKHMKILVPRKVQVRANY